MSNELVVKSNYVIEASYKLTLNEQRLILLCVRQIKKGQNITAGSRFDISAADFADMFEISADRAYSELQAVTDKLYERSVTVQQPDPDRPNVATTKTRWVSAIDYMPNEGRVSMYFAVKMVPYISMLEGGFTRYNLQNISGMGSVYGIRFYEFFKSWLFGGVHSTKKIALEELKEKLELTGKYTSIKDFKLYVLDKAIADINECSDLTAKYKTIKTGRKITHVEFEFQDKSGQRKERSIQRIDTAYIEKYARPGESYEQAGKRLKEEAKKQTK
ncbi:RepB family plasmid replication initiator protein [Leucothrix pacifica]|uniref:RepB family plasmid replication initiator protein n=1 Tax=Leucothrix pacifica TaxID=1247513 RepID=A0A317CAC6_9GAMM|nr:RepB family plasmid replication initiator protein [Leucothrix pacifica]PWQ95091.1 RepB family plasmid replication initiator protein [Leucothrix pacifica]